MCIYLFWRIDSTPEHRPQYSTILTVEIDWDIGFETRSAFSPPTAATIVDDLCVAEWPFEPYNTSSGVLLGLGCWPLASPIQKRSGTANTASF